MAQKTDTLGIYIHIPFCKQKCSYCNFAAYEGVEAYEDAYVASVLRELRMHLEMTPSLKTRLIDTIYFGGGTPTHLSLPSIECILTTVHDAFSVTKNCEITIESNPGERSLEYFSNLVRMGFNRISFGIQTLNDDLLKFLRRTHTSNDVLHTLKIANQAGFLNISGDLIYALPNQTMDMLKESLRICQSGLLNHISIYGLQLENGSYLEKLYRMNTLVLPQEDVSEAMYDCMIDTCEANGYERYEISNFARDKAYGRHNLKYWTYADYLGIGCGAHGFYNNRRYGNTPYIVPYINSLASHKLPLVDEVKININRSIEDFCFLALRTKWGISPADYDSRFNRNFAEDYGDVISKLLLEEVIEKNIYNSYSLTRKGAKYGNYVFEKFLR